MTAARGSLYNRKDAPCRSVGIGRRTGLKIRRTSLGVWVQVPPPAPPFNRLHTENKGICPADGSSAQLVLSLCIRLQCNPGTIRRRTPIARTIGRPMRAGRPVFRSPSHIPGYYTREKSPGLCRLDAAKTRLLAELASKWKRRKTPLLRPSAAHPFPITRPSNLAAYSLGKEEKRTLTKPGACSGTRRRRGATIDSGASSRRICNCRLRVIRSMRMYRARR